MNTATPEPITKDSLRQALERAVLSNGKAHTADPRYFNSDGTAECIIGVALVELGYTKEYIVSQVRERAQAHGDIDYVPNASAVWLLRLLGVTDRHLMNAALAVQGRQDQKTHWGYAFDAFDTAYRQSEEAQRIKEQAAMKRAEESTKNLSDTLVTVASVTAHTGEALKLINCSIYNNHFASDEISFMQIGDPAQAPWTWSPGLKNLVSA